MKPLTAALLALLLAGCGSSQDRISSSTADELHHQVNAIRAAVTAARNPTALAAVADLRTTIRRLAGSGELDPADSLVLLTQLDRIATLVEDRATPTPVTVSNPGPDGPAPKHPPKGTKGKPGKDKDK